MSHDGSVPGKGDDEPTREDLLAQLAEARAQQVATAEVLKAISRAAFDLRAVLQALLETAARLCDASICILFRLDPDGLLRPGASFGGTPAFVENLAANPNGIDRRTIAGRAILEGRTVHVGNILEDPDYGTPQSYRLGGWRSIIGVPLLRENRPLGALALARPEPGPFSPRQIELVESFADQAVIAIENARLFEEVQSRTRDLEQSLKDLRTTQDRLVQTEKLAALGQLTAGIAHEIKNPLNFVNNFSALSAELVDELQEVLAAVPLDAGVRGQVEEISVLLKGNLEKVTSHGRRADSIVRTMLQHSRSGSGERRNVDVNALVEESLALAYHGERAKTAGFNVTLRRDYDPAAGEAELFPQEIARVLLNLFGNGFHAMRKQAGDAGPGYAPLLTVATDAQGDAVAIRIRDNGTGITQDVMQKMFDPFFTTKPTGEGTGLGLSLSHDIVVKQHGGRIDVTTEPGLFTEFTITLPRGEAGRPD